MPNTNASALYGIECNTCGERNPDAYRSHAGALTVANHHNWYYPLHSCRVTQPEAVRGEPVRAAVPNSNFRGILDAELHADAFHYTFDRADGYPVAVFEPDAYSDGCPTEPDFGPGNPDPDKHCRCGADLHPNHVCAIPVTVEDGYADPRPCGSCADYQEAVNAGRRPPTVLSYTTGSEQHTHGYESFVVIGERAQ